MIYDTLKARLNLNAVLRNLEELPDLDPETAAMIKAWDISIRFRVLRGISARLQFKDGHCTYEENAKEASDVVLFFLSHKHLNGMFDEKAPPIPLKGFKRLGFLKDEFSRVTKRLEYFLKPTPELLEEPEYVRVNTALTLSTAVHAARELVLLDPVAKQVGRQTPSGLLQIQVLPDGPNAWMQYDGKGGIVSGRGKNGTPAATLTFRDRGVACALFNGKLDDFGAVALGDVKLRGLVPIIDNTNLILDRIPAYLQ